MKEKWYAEMVSIKKKSGMTNAQIAALDGIHEIRIYGGEIKIEL